MWCIVLYLAIDQHPVVHVAPLPHPAEQVVAADVAAGTAPHVRGPDKWMVAQWVGELCRASDMTGCGVHACLGGSGRVVVVVVVAGATAVEP